MRRREFLGLLGGAAAVWPLSAHAQQPLPIIGYLNGLTVADRPVLREAFREGLKIAGYVEGRNVAIEYRYAGSQMDQLRTLARELVARPVDVIVATGGNNPGLVAKSLTSAIPIVFTSGIDPVKAGLVTNLGRPEGNVTGVSWFATELGNKHLELLRELVPSAVLVGLVVNRNNPEAEVYERSVREAAHILGVQLLVLDGRTANEVDAAFTRFAQQRTSGVLISGDPFLSSRAPQIVALAAHHAIPVVYANRDYTEAGGLINYGNNVPDAYRRAGIYTGRILNGTKPADLPIDRATKFELVLNAKTAKALSLDIPLSLQMRIDEVIE